MDKKRKFCKTILMLIIFLNFYSMRSQEILINLSIEWKTVTNNFKCISLKNNQTICVPFLKIKYYNNSNESYYFKSALDDELKYAPVGFSVTSNETNLICEEKNILKNDFKKNYVVIENKDIFDAFILYEDSFKISDKNERFAAIRELFNIQDKLEKINSNRKLKYFDTPHKKNISYQKALIEVVKYTYPNQFIDKSDITEDSILKNLKSKFVFLKPNETKESKVNLLAFLIIEGDYDFSLDKHFFDGNINAFNTNENKISSEIVQLPANIKEYKLYKGKLESNIVNLKTNK